MNELQELLAVLRAAAWTYQTGHWIVQGSDYYGNHLLLMRLYEETGPQVDGTGERIVGYGGSVDQADQVARASKYVTRWASIADPMKRSLVAANVVRDAVHNARSALQQAGSLTIGLDNFLQGIADVKDQHVYLLQQATKD